MSLGELQEQLGLPRKIRLSRELWLAAAVLGRLRTLVNDEYRRRVRDRGTAKNILNDLQGSIGELVGLELLDRAHFRAVAQGLLDLRGSVDRPDLIAPTDPPIALDVKCHFDESPKRLFLVNEQARVRSVNRGVVAILPIVTAALHRDAYVGALIPIKQLAEWRKETVGRYGDPSRQISLTALDRKFLGGPRIRWGTRELSGQWGPQILSDHYLDRLQSIVGSSMVARLRHDRFSLDGLTYGQVLKALLNLLPSELR